MKKSWPYALSPTWVLLACLYNVWHTGHDDSPQYGHSYAFAFAVVFAVVAAGLCAWSWILWARDRREQRRRQDA